MSTLFYLNPNHQLKNKTAVSNIINLAGDNMPPLPRPIEYRAIDVIKEFKWTKTIRSEDFNIDNVPALYLKEYYVTQPGFASNVQNITNSIIDTLDTIRNSEVVTNFLPSLKNEEQEAEGEGEEPIGTIQATRNKLNAIVNWANLGSTGIPTGDQRYMRAYEDLYGVLFSDFEYIIPYFNNSFKNIETSWSLDKQTKGLTKEISSIGGKNLNLGSVAEMITTGFGFDFAKTYNYPDKGPSVTFNLYLDNTYDSAFDSNTNNTPPWQRNWDLIFLLLYQNLPHKRNRIFFDPPVIYKATVPGVFSYLYSYMSSLQVECVGNRQRQSVGVVTLGSQNTFVAANQYSPDYYTTLIPEAYKIQITLTSLLPETKNLMLYGLQGDNITVKVEPRRPGDGVDPRNDLGISSTNAQANRQRFERNTPR